MSHSRRPTSPPDALQQRAPARVAAQIFKAGVEFELQRIRVEPGHGPVEQRKRLVGAPASGGEDGQHIGRDQALGTTLQGLRHQRVGAPDVPAMACAPASAMKQPG